MTVSKDFAEIRRDDFRAWTRRDPKRKEWLADVFLRAPGGVLHMLRRYRRRPPSERTLRRHTREHNNVSSRPFRLGQRSDGSIGSCVFALLLDFCKVRRWEANELYKKAYPDEKGPTDQKWDEIREQANWEGIVYPPTWDAAAIEGLVKSLLSMNRRSLAGVLQDAVKESASHQ